MRDYFILVVVSKPFDIFWYFVYFQRKVEADTNTNTYDMYIYNVHRRNITNLSKQTFCNIKLKFQTPRTVSNGNHFLQIYSLFVEDRKFMVVFSISMQYFRYFIPPLILGLSPKHLHLYK